MPVPRCSANWPNSCRDTCAPGWSTRNVPLTLTSAAKLAGTLAIEAATKTAFNSCLRDACNAGEIHCIGSVLLCWSMVGWVLLRWETRC